MNTEKSPKESGSAKLPVSGSLPLMQFAQLRDELYNQMPTGEVTAWQLTQLLTQHIKRMDELTERFSGNDR